MSLISPIKIVKLADNISALYRLGVISSDTKDEMAACLKLRSQEGLDSLYLQAMDLPDHPVVCAICDIILEN